MLHIYLILSHGKIVNAFNKKLTNKRDQRDVHWKGIGLNSTVRCRQ